MAEHDDEEISGEDAGGRVGASARARHPEPDLPGNAAAKSRPAQALDRGRRAGGRSSPGEVGRAEERSSRISGICTRSSIPGSTRKSPRVTKRISTSDLTLGRCAGGRRGVADAPVGRGCGDRIAPADRSDLAAGRSVLNSTAGTFPPSGKRFVRSACEGRPQSGSPPPSVRCWAARAPSRATPPLCWPRCGPRPTTSGPAGPRPSTCSGRSTGSTGWRWPPPPPPGWSQPARSPADRGRWRSPTRTRPCAGRSAGSAPR